VRREFRAHFGIQEVQVDDRVAGAFFPTVFRGSSQGSNPFFSLDAVSPMGTRCFRAYSAVTLTGQRLWNRSRARLRPQGVIRGLFRSRETRPEGSEHRAVVPAKHGLPFSNRFIRLTANDLITLIARECRRLVGHADVLGKPAASVVDAAAKMRHGPLMEGQPLSNIGSTTAALESCTGWQTSRRRVAATRGFPDSFGQSRQ
jgi:hypothetical protein